MTSWAEIIPSVIASVVTTLLTLFVAHISRRISSSRAANNEPLLLRRGAGSSWTLNNVSKTALTGVNLSIINAAGQWQQAAYQPGQSILHPKVPHYIQTLGEGDSVNVNWVKLRKWRPDEYYSAEARVKNDLDEIPLRHTKHSGRPNGGGK